MKSLIPVLLACALTAACSSTGGSGGRPAAGQKAKGEPILLVFTDYHTGARLELANESHTDRVKQYSEQRNDANRKVQSDDLMNGLVAYLDEQGFSRDATPGDPPYMTGGDLRWTLQVMRAAGESYVAEARTASTREKRRLRIYSKAFLDTYNHTQGWQAVKIESGQMPFKGPNIKPTGGKR
jgi:hypothetical protein